MDEIWWNKYIGKSFEVKGRGPDTFDCWGFLQYIYKHHHPSKILLPGYEDLYDDVDDKERLSNAIFEQKQERWVEVEKPQPFDAVLLRLRGVPMHVGVVTKPGSMIHCAYTIGVAHEKYTSMRWSNKVLGFFHYE